MSAPYDPSRPLRFELFVAPARTRKRTQDDAPHLIAQGIQADRRLAVYRNWDFGGFNRLRPIGFAEFNALFYKVAALPGVKRPKYGIMRCELEPETRIIKRYLYRVNRGTWQFCSEKYYAGEWWPFVPDLRYWGLEIPHPIYKDKIPCEAEIPHSGSV